MLCPLFLISAYYMHYHCTKRVRLNHLQEEVNTRAHTHTHTHTLSPYLILSYQNSKFQFYRISCLINTNPRNWISAVQIRYKHTEKRHIYTHQCTQEYRTTGTHTHTHTTVVSRSTNSSLHALRLFIKIRSTWNDFLFSVC